MEPTKEEIKAAILDCFKSNNRPDVESLSLFVENLISGINFDTWDSLKPSPEKNVPDYQKMSEADLLKNIDLFSEEKNEATKELKLITSAYLWHANEFFRLYRDTKDFFLHGDSRLENYRKVISRDPYRLEEFEGMLDDMIEALEKDLNDIPEVSIRLGRKKEYDLYVFTRHIFVMADCLFDVKSKPSNGNSTFNKILRACFDIAGYQDQEECKLYVTPCWKDSGTVSAMQGRYQQYGREDLFQKHVLEAEMQGHFPEIFDE